MPFPCLVGAALVAFAALPEETQEIPFGNSGYVADVPESWELKKGSVASEKAKTKSTKLKGATTSSGIWEAHVPDVEGGVVEFHPGVSWQRRSGMPDNAHIAWQMKYDRGDAQRQWAAFFMESDRYSIA